MRNRGRQQPHLVTSAAQSREIEFEARKRRYLITMAARAVLLVAAMLAATVSIWLAVTIGAVSMVLPWVAVVMANDGPPRVARKAAAKVAAKAPPERRVISAGPVVIDENGATIRRDQEGT